MVPPVLPFRKPTMLAPPQGFRATSIAAGSIGTAVTFNGRITVGPDINTGDIYLNSNIVLLGTSAIGGYRAMELGYNNRTDQALACAGIVLCNPSVSESVWGIISQTASLITSFRGTSSTAGSSLELLEMTAPAAGAADTCRIYCVDAAGKTQLRAIFATGASQLIVAEP